MYQLLIGLFLLPIPVQAVETPVTPVYQATEPVKELTIDEKITYYAKKYNVSRTRVDGIIYCESRYNPTIQSRYRYLKDNPKLGIKAGEQERSFGLAQIHLPAHPYVTYEQAIDEDFAIDFVAKHVKAGDAPQMYVHCYNSTKDV